jgi:hypothetical protein
MNWNIILNFNNWFHSSFNCISVHSSIVFSYFSDVWWYGRSIIVVYHNVPNTSAAEFRRSDMFARKQKIPYESNFILFIKYYRLIYLLIVGPTIIYYNY